MIESGNITLMTGLVLSLVGLGAVLDRTALGKHVPSAVVVMVIAIVLVVALMVIVIVTTMLSRMK